MKSLNLLLTAAIAIAVIGCQTKPTRITNLPSLNQDPLVSASTNGDKITPDDNLLSTDTPVLPNPTNYSNWVRTPETFSALTVHFDYDSSVIKSGEDQKLQQIAEHLKANPVDALCIEGHCDERGTEEYNRSLGDRRALALREALAKLGIESIRLDSISFGKDRPIDLSNTEAANRLNRRGEFVLLTPPK